METKGLTVLQGGKDSPSGTNAVRSPVALTANETAKALVKNLATAKQNRVEVSQDFHGIKVVAHANGEVTVVIPGRSLTLTRQEVSRLIAKGLELAKSSKSDIAMEFSGMKFSFGRKGNLTLEWTEETAKVSDPSASQSSAPPPDKVEEAKRPSFLTGLGSVGGVTTTVGNAILRAAQKPSAPVAPATPPTTPVPKKAPTVDEVVAEANAEAEVAIGLAMEKTTEEFVRFLRGEKDTSAIPFDPERHIRQGSRGGWGLVEVAGFGKRVDCGKNWDGGEVVADMKKMSCYESLLPFQGFRWTPEFRAVYAVKDGETTRIFPLPKEFSEQVLKAWNDAENKRTEAVRAKKASEERMARQAEAEAKRAKELAEGEAANRSALEEQTAKAWETALADRSEAKGWFPLADLAQEGRFELVNMGKLPTVDALTGKSRFVRPQDGKKSHQALTHLLVDEVSWEAIGVFQYTAKALPEKTISGFRLVPPVVAELQRTLVEAFWKQKDKDVLFLNGTKVADLLRGTAPRVHLAEELVGYHDDLTGQETSPPKKGEDHRRLVGRLLDREGGRTVGMLQVTWKHLTGGFGGKAILSPAEEARYHWLPPVVAAIQKWVEEELPEVREPKRKDPVVLPPEEQVAIANGRREERRLRGHKSEEARRLGEEALARAIRRGGKGVDAAVAFGHGSLIAQRDAERADRAGKKSGGKGKGGKKPAKAQSGKPAGKGGGKRGRRGGGDE